MRESRSAWACAPAVLLAAVLASAPAFAVDSFVEFRLVEVEPDGAPGNMKVAVSPGGENVYVMTVFYNGVVSSAQLLGYDRDAGTGELVLAQTLTDGTVPELIGGRDIVISPDGDHVYVAAEFNLLVLQRDGLGTLTPADVVALPQAVSHLAISPDGAQVYRASAGFIDVYARNAGSGALTLMETVTDGIDGAFAGTLVVSSDGGHVYVARHVQPAQGDSVLAFARDGGTGGLTFVDGFAAGGGIVSLVESPDGGSVYVATADEPLAVGSVAAFSRDAVSGALMFVAEYSRRSGRDIGAPEGLGITPDGRYLLAVQASGSPFEGVLAFRRDVATSELTLVEADDLGGANFSGGNPGMVAVAPDGQHAYASIRDTFVLALVGRACEPQPLAGCRQPTRPRASKLVVRDDANDVRDRLIWNWRQGQQTDVADLGNPEVDTSYLVCLYDETAAVPALVGSAFAAAGGSCAVRPCWKARGTPPGDRGFLYANREAGTGLERLLLVPGADGAARVVVRGAGAALDLAPPPLAQDSAVVAQVVSTDGECWEATFSSPALHNEPGHFSDRSD